jgi:thioredoxin 1
MNSTLQFTDANFQSEVLDSDQPVLVDFWAAWCGPCRVVSPTIEEVANQYEGTARVGKLNVDENPQTAVKFDIRSIPSVLLFKDGKVIQTMVGVQPKEHYEQALERFVATV